MAAYIISYDLRRQRNYDALIDQLREWGCISPLRSVWLGHFNDTASAIRDALRQHMDSDDGLLVIELKRGASWGTRLVNENGADWLREALRRE